MASVAFAAQDESQPSTSNANLPTTLLDGCRAVKHASVPKKLRSAIKKRGRESITLPLPIQKKKHHMSNGGDTLRKDGKKKSKREGHMSKDEEEVAQTLYALAAMFSDAKKVDQSASDNEKPETKSIAKLEGGSINATQGEESRKISSKVTLDSSYLVDSTAQIVKSQSLGALQLTSNTCVVQSDINLGSRPAASMAPQEIDLEHVGPSGVEYGKNYNPIDHKCKDTFPSSTPSSETLRSCPSTRVPESTNVCTQPPIIEESITTEKYGTESKKSWKRCTAHVYISRLIKVLQISDREEECPAHNGRNGGASSSGINDSFAAHNDSSEMQNDIFIHKRPLQDQQMASQTICSTEQGYDFLSLGGGLAGMNRVGPSYEPPKQYHVSYMQSQDHSSMLFLHNSQQVPLLPQYHSNFVMEPHEHNWGGGAVGRESASVLNYAHALFPHLDAALSPSQELLLALNTNMKRHLPLGFQKNGAAFSSQNMQLPCNHHL